MEIIFDWTRSIVDVVCGSKLKFIYSSLSLHKAYVYLLAALRGCSRADGRCQSTCYTKGCFVIHLEAGIV